MPDGARIDRSLDRFVDAERRRHAVPAVAVGILHEGRRHTTASGVTNVAHPAPVDPGTLFQIGSATKTYTATAVMRLVERGRLDLHAPVRRYLPELRLRSRKAQAGVTLLHLLTHTGGWLGDHFEDTGRGDDALARIVAGMSGIPQLTPLGTVWSYNNAGFYVAGRVIEKVTRMPYERAIGELLFAPLGMTRSFFFAEDALPHRVAVGHVATGRTPVVATPWALQRSCHPAGGIIADVDDQLTWAAFHMGDGRASSGARILRRRTIELMRRPQAPAGGMAEHVGIAWLLRAVGGHRLVTHGGTTNGQMSAFVMVPDRSFAISVLTNSTSGGRVAEAVVAWALEHYLGIEPSAPPRLTVPRGELEAYVGPYRIESSGATFTVTARAGGLAATLPAPSPVPTDVPLPVPGPTAFAFIAHDRVVATNGYRRGAKGEFLRGSRGDVTWFRFGGRIHRRLPSDGRHRPASRRV